METKENVKRPARPAGAPPRRNGNPQKKRRRPSNPQKPTQDVVYTQPGPFNRNRFLLHLAAIVAVVFALLFGMSIFFKVEVVTVAGVNKYTEWDICQASGIQMGENLLTVSEAKISSSIRSKLPYVSSVRVGIKLPDTVKIEIVELDVVYAIEESGGNWWLIRADGNVIEKTSEPDSHSYTRILGVQITEPEVGSPAVAYQPIPQETTADGQTVPITTHAADQLQTAVTILQYLEENGVIGEAATVDVTDLSDLQMWWRDERFQIVFGDSTQLSYKIKLVKTAIDHYMETYDSGILDVSLTIQPDPDKEYQVIYTPFE